MQSLVADTLKAWREAERVLTGMSPLDPNHDTIRAIVVELRAMYAKVSESNDLSAEAISQWRSRLAEAVDALARARAEPA